MVSGKVDRSMLPEPAGSRLMTVDGPVVAAATELEEQVRAVWADAFGVDPDQVSVEADFFVDLGGHSLLAATVVSLLRERGVGRSPAVRDLYANPTVRGLADRLGGAAPPDGVIPDAPRPEPLRHSSLRFGLAGCAQVGFLIALLLIVTLPVAAVYSANGGQVSLLMLGELAAAATGIYLGVRWVLAPMAVRALAIGMRPGRYPLWGITYLRLWAMDLMLALSPLPVLSGSPLLAGYLRLLGARVGQRTHLGTAMLEAFLTLRYKFASD